MKRIMLSVMCISLVSANFTKAEVPKGTFVVDGALVDKSGTPVTNQTIYVFPFEKTYLKMQYEQGRLANPRGTTDVKGRFQIAIPLDFVKLGENFTLGIQEFVGLEMQTRSLTRNGVPLVFSLSKDDTLRKVSVGDIIFETKSNAQSIQAAKENNSKENKNFVPVGMNNLEIPVVGVIGPVELFEDSKLDKKKGSLEAGTTLTVLTSEDGALRVKTRTGEEGWLRRCWVCTSSEYDRRKAQN